MIKVSELDAQWPEDLRMLLLHCREELLNPEYAAYQHGQRNTRARGCNGPMCRKAARDYGREVQRRLNDAQTERKSLVRRFDEYLDAYIQYAARVHTELTRKRASEGVMPPKRRRLKPTRTLRRSHLIPLSTAKMLHKSRARLAS